MGREVLEGLRVSQSQQHPLSSKINIRIIANPGMVQKNSTVVRIILSTYLQKS